MTAHCPNCDKETHMEFIETDSTWRNAGISDYVSGYWICLECDERIYV